MKLGTLLTLYAIILAFFGVMLLLAPNTFISWYGPTSMNGVSVTGYRYIGAFAFAFVAVAWLVRKAEPSKTRDAIVMGITIQNALCTLVAIRGSMIHVFNDLAWGQVALSAIFTLAFFFVGRASMAKAK